ncbi:hypothetical protein [Cochleicola gelatinilyticus]|uniref:Uncharacterized protein n=1 Tax=Cochleicola gelatinilyticus TaxID=1763537 RepID=A0A167H5J5_9FLAO|nr:hypothetical protein [Cochleicola gelatinilyticus]OAB78237.1 hypothetical protein ULVI_12230 [Cochleicola gelatinilyticus]
MKKVLFYSILLITFSCQQKNNAVGIITTSENSQSTNINYISFTEYNASVPANYELHIFKSIEVDKDSVYLKEYTYKFGKPSESILLSSYESKVKNREFINKLEVETTTESQTIGQLGNEYDGGGIHIKIITKNMDTITSNMSYKKNTIRADLRFILDFYLSIKEKIYN